MSERSLRARPAALASSVTLHPETGQIRRGRVDRRSGGVTLHLPKALPSPNQWLWAHWRQKHSIKAAWAAVIQTTAIDASSAGARLARQTTPAGAVGWIAPPGRALVLITRQLRSRRHFITDRDNLVFAGKGLVDCLVQAGFLRDDSTEHIDLAVDQVVTTDGLDWTVVAIDAIPEEIHAP